MMAQRPILSTFVAFAIAATAMRITTGPSAPSVDLNESQVAPRSVKTGAKQAPLSPQDSWSDRIKRDPTAEGRSTAQAELKAKICGFIQCPIAEGNARTGGNSSPWLTLTSADDDATKAMYSAKAQVLLAIAPDPAHSHEGLLFDRLIDAF